jgi:hypothetical protein
MADIERALEFFGDERIIGEIASFFREHGSRIRPEPLEVAAWRPGKKPPSGICVTICDTAVKLVRGYFAFMKVKGCELEFESEEEIIISRSGDSPDQLQDYFHRHKHKKINLRIKP